MLFCLNLITEQKSFQNGAFCEVGAALVSSTAQTAARMLKKS